MVRVELVPVFPRPPYDVLLYLGVILLQSLPGLQQMQRTSVFNRAFQVAIGIDDVVRYTIGVQRCVRFNELLALLMRSDTTSVFM